MTREVEAIFEGGVLRPMEPLPFAEKQRVQVTVRDLPKTAGSPVAREQELSWLKENAQRYKGEYVAVAGSELVSHGPNGSAVIAEARAKGFAHALFHYVPESFGEPSFELF